MSFWDGCLTDDELAYIARGKPLPSKVSLPGYHLADIPRGTYGEFSKIEEELAEAKDAFEQGVKIMGLVELADMMLAVKGFLEKHHPDVSMGDLMDMASVTERAFVNGHRKPKA